MSTSQVFIPHEEFVWVTGQILVDADAKGQVQVKVSDEACPDDKKAKLISLAKFGIPSLPQQNIDIPVNGVEDMTKLNYLHEPAILDNLRRRHKNSTPYTYTGEVCIAVNPYKWLPLYTDELRAKYSKSTRHELAPHVYATSTDAYRGLTIRTKNQSILVTGESGAGKTETVKILMGHLAFIAGKSDDKTIDKLLKANPLLESFGNAKTGRNDNSSRFGKFSQLEFDDLYVLVGSKCITYLLEKSRVITQTKLERNYHIMYQLLAAPDSVKSHLLLTGKSVTSFNYTSSGDTKTNVIEGMTDSDRYNQTVQGLELLGVGPKLRSLLEQAIAGILHMGQVNFLATKGSADASYIELDDSTKAACKMLGVIPNIFATSVVSRVIEVEGKKLDVPLSVAQASSGKDALAKEIYSRIFNWLILVINFNTSFSCNATEEVRARKTAKNGGICSTISLLDIFGFECFAKNGFEQFCINYANEKLQQRFTQDVFMTVQREYQEEGLPWEIIKYKDNQDTLDMIEGRLGIVDLLNEECQIPKGTDTNFLAKIKQSFSPHHAFSTDPRARDNFTVRHYAGQVTYTITGFMDANKDAVPNNLTTLLSSSENALVKRLFCDTPFFSGQGETEILFAEEPSFVVNLLLLNMDEGEYSTVPISDTLTSDRITTSVSGKLQVIPKSGSNDDVTGTRPRAATSVRKAAGGFVVGEKIFTKFRNQLASLMEMVNATDVQYVRTIKPNPHKSDIEYDRRMVVEQLRSAGMIEAVRISRAAYPNRLVYNDFMNRFHILKPKKWHAAMKEKFESQNNKSPEEVLKNTTKAFLAGILPDNRKALNDGTGTTTHYAFGHTKVYFTSFVLETLEAARNKAVFNQICSMQKIVRGFLTRRKFLRIIEAARVLRRNIPVLNAKAKLRKIRKALIKIQSLAAMRYIRKRYLFVVSEYRKDGDLAQAQSALESGMNLEGMRAKAEEERAKRVALAEAARLKAIEDKLRAEEELRRDEEDRIRKIEEKKRAEEAKLRYYETLDKKVQEDALLIEQLKRSEEDSRASAEVEKTRLRRLEARLTEALDKIDALESREATARNAAFKQEMRTKELEAQLAESAGKVAALLLAEQALKMAHDNEVSRLQASEARTKACAATEKQRLLEAQEELLEIERQRKLAPVVKQEPTQGDVDVVIEEEKGRLRVVVVRKKVTGEVVVE